MTKLLALALWVVGSTALASSTVEGEAIFNASCSQCHTATQPLFTPDGKGKARPATRTTAWAGPDLVTVVTTRPEGKLRMWIAGPTRVKPDTACRIFAIPRPAVDGLLMYLRSVSKPPALTAKAIQRQNLKEGVARLRVEKLKKKPVEKKPLTAPARVNGKGN